ncbi:MAG: hypothetical protein M3Z64_04670 [Verrucomicrobiota bacterium]|nr:hypothetical protein [Verrucomicrobiota bacterium]
MNVTTTSRLAIILAVIALLLLVVAEGLNVAHGKRVDVFHALFGLGMLAFTISLVGRGTHGR